jgi:hypothetical protein
MTTTPDTLNSEMPFDHVVRVTDGVLTAEPDIHAPELRWSNGHVEMDPAEGWVLMDGYSGQFRYGGPIMHESEYIGGRMADDILARDGVFVALVCHDYDEATEDEMPTCGWAVAIRVED